MGTVLTRRAVLAAAALATLPARADVQDMAWTDLERQRTLPLRLRWPDGAGPGPWPLLLYSHGLGGSREGGDLWSRAWRDAGFAVLHLQHPGSDASVWAQGMAALRAAASVQQLIARVGDVKFVLDELARQQARGIAPWPQLDLGAIGMAGHSFGAQTVAALAGKRYAVDAPGLVDARLRAFMAFSPALSPGAMSAGEQFGAVTRPFMCLTGSLDGDPLGSQVDGAPRWRVFEGLPAGAKAGLWLEHADHLSFAGQALPRRAAGPLGRRDARALEAEPRHRRLVAELSTLWWRANLCDDRAASATLRQPQGLGPADRWVQA